MIASLPVMASFKSHVAAVRSEFYTYLGVAEARSFLNSTSALVISFKIFTNVGTSIPYFVLSPLVLIVISEMKLVAPNAIFLSTLVQVL